MDTDYWYGIPYHFVVDPLLIVTTSFVVLGVLALVVLHARARKNYSSGVLTALVSAITVIFALASMVILTIVSNNSVDATHEASLKTWALSHYGISLSNKQAGDLWADMMYRQSGDYDGSAQSVTTTYKGKKIHLYLVEKGRGDYYFLSDTQYPKPLH